MNEKGGRNMPKRMCEPGSNLQNACCRRKTRKRWETIYQNHLKEQMEKMNVQFREARKVWQLDHQRSI